MANRLLRYYFRWQQEGAVMGMVFTLLSIAVAVAVLGLVAFVLVVEPFVDHSEHFRDPRGRRLGSSPRLD